MHIELKFAVITGKAINHAECHCCCGMRRTYLLGQKQALCPALMLTSFNAAMDFLTPAVQDFIWLQCDKFEPDIIQASIRRSAAITVNNPSGIILKRK